MKAENIEQIITFLKSCGIETSNDQKPGVFNRVIEFEVEGTIYFIEWWINQSYLKFKNKFSAPYLPFKYIYINENYPTAEHSLQLCFFDELPQGNKENTFYSPIPFGCMKIPFNLPK
jgi:hypothetical protein